VEVKIQYYKAENQKKGIKTVFFVKKLKIDLPFDRITGAVLIGKANFVPSAKNVP
jgi:hypothetical protein